MTAPTASDPNALIPIADFITYIEAVEKTFIADNPGEIVTRIRDQYYGDFGFQQLIPNAHFMITIGKPPPGPNGMVLPDVQILRRIDSSIGADAWSHLSAHADENAKQDNPSPYLVLADGTNVDAGHMLLLLDALLNPATAWPFTTYGIPNMDPAGLVADLGLASYWCNSHATTGHPVADVVAPPATADFNAYYLNSAPDPDLYGDADGFGMHTQWTATGGKLSEVARAYYLGGGVFARAADPLPGPSRAGGAIHLAAVAGIKRRWRTFCLRNSLPITGSAVTLSAALTASWVARIDRMADLAEDGKLGALWQVATPGEPPRRKRVESEKAFQRFIQWMNPLLAAEMAANP